MPAPVKRTEINSCVDEKLQRDNKLRSHCRDGETNMVDM